MNNDIEKKNIIASTAFPDDKLEFNNKPSMMDWLSIFGNNKKAKANTTNPSKKVKKQRKSIRIARRKNRKKKKS